MEFSISPVDPVSSAVPVDRRDPVCPLQRNPDIHWMGHVQRDDGHLTVVCEQEEHLQLWGERGRERGREGERERERGRGRK